MDMGMGVSVSGGDPPSVAVLLEIFACADDSEGGRLACPLGLAKRSARTAIATAIATPIAFATAFMRRV